MRQNLNVLSASVSLWALSLSVKVRAELKFNSQCFTPWSRSGWGGVCSSSFFSTGCCTWCCRLYPVMFFSIVHYLLCWEFSVFVFIRGSLALSLLLFLTLNEYSYPFFSSSFSRFFFLISFCFYIGCESGCFYLTFLKYALILFQNVH